VTRNSLSRRFIVIATIASTSAVLGVAIVYGAGIPDPKLAPRVADATPGAGARSVTARAMTKRGEVGVLVYRNEAGQRCIAAGRPNGNTVGGVSTSSFTEVPLGEVGQCNLPLDPVGFQIMHSAGEVTVIGLAADTVQSIELTAGGTTKSTRPAADDAFILSIPHSVVGALTLRATSATGKVETISMPPLPDLEQLNKEMRQNAPPLKGG
jgi:hypothetical protein